MRWWLIGILSIISVIFVAIYYYRSDQPSAEIVTLSPTSLNTKTRPKDRGGINVPNKDSAIYNKMLYRKSRLSLSPEPEKPVALIAKKAGKSHIYTGSIDEILDNLDYYEQLYQSNDLDQIDESDVILPNEINVAQAQETPVKIAENKDSDFIVFSSNSNKLERYLMKKQVSTKKTIERFSLQLDVVNTHDQGKKLWQNLQKKYNKALGAKQLILRRVDKGSGKVYYHVMAGYYDSYEKAAHICKRLISGNQPCFVVREE